MNDAQFVLAILRLLAEEQDLTVSEVLAGQRTEECSVRFATIFFLSHYYRWRNKRIIDNWPARITQPYVSRRIARVKSATTGERRNSLYLRLLARADSSFCLASGGTWERVEKGVAA